LNRWHPSQVALTSIRNALLLAIWPVTSWPKRAARAVKCVWFPQKAQVP